MMKYEGTLKQFKQLKLTFPPESQYKGLPVTDQNVADNPGVLKVTLSGNVVYQPVHIGDYLYNLPYIGWVNIGGQDYQKMDNCYN